MKKKLVVYLAGLLTVLGLGFGQAQFSDVPAGHWAKEAVERIAACGLITGFPDGTFRGNTNLTRYQAALIFQRLLNEIQQGGECVKADGKGLSEEDLTAIRNAVQELAAELAALGVRVSALEDNAASKDDIARLEAAIEELKAMKAEPAAGMDEAALADLADRVEAASVAADTALAQAQVLAERLDAVEGDVAALKTQVEADADSIRALNELAVLLNQDVLSLQDRVTALEKQLGDVDFESFANREDVSAIQEFATALRSDLVRLSDRVSALDTRVGALDQRLTAVEGTRPTLTGSLSATYGYATNTGGNFDIDRLFPNNALSSGTGADDSSGNRIRNAFRRGDFDQTYTYGGATLNFGLKPTGGAISEVSLGLSADLVNSGAARTLALNSASVKGSLSGQAFSVTYNNDDSTFSFNPYLFNNSTVGDLITTRGFVATLDAKAFPLAPKFTVVAGEGIDSTSVPAASRVWGSDPTYGGLRAELNLLGITTGLSYAENRGNRSAFGVDYKGSLFGLVNLEGAYVASTPFAFTPDFSNQLVTDQAFYTKIGVKLGILEANFNYRAIDPQYNNGQAGLSSASSYYFFGLGGNGEAPYGANNIGFGFDGKLTLSFLNNIEARVFYDNSADFATRSQTADTLSLGVTVPLFAGFSLNGFYNNTNVNGGQVSAVAGTQSGLNGNYNFYVYNNLDARWSSGWGVKLVHSGRASNALVPNLDLNLWYQSFAGPDAGTDILASAGYNLKLGFISLNPIVRYHSFADAAGGNTNLSTNALKYGIGVSTDPLGIPLKPSLEGAFVQQSITETAPGSNSSSEQYWRVGLNLNEFLATGSVFKVGYAQYRATNVVSPLPVGGAPARGFGNFPLSITTDRVFNYPGEVQYPWNLTGGFGTNSGSVTGLYLEWKYGNLTMAAASATLANGSGATVSNGTGFKISYEVKF
ncbi:S-layer homology domain-containing protein [Meiothermus taiwanensis]|uniref:S-layer protein SlpA n=1 Tax=Meiothermus taiwanensis TaxID=172827 RepID=A0A399E9U8_9DEIN|nr:S-layer homology domain-containing protein [Meiothermus taiwanensis]KIQ54419.1 S-layer protein [Meiothermus taiwanensis]RIH79939.1 S-layer protein SlpA [Meiothermus taiwanensis]GIW30411.1 MAG: S-layer protein [Meiothermus sp.]